MFAVPAKKPLTFVDWLSSFFYTPPVKSSCQGGIILQLVLDDQELLAMCQLLEFRLLPFSAGCDCLFSALALATAFIRMESKPTLPSKFDRPEKTVTVAAHVNRFLNNLKFSTRVCYSITQVLISLLGSFALTWIFFHKLFPLPPKEVTFWDRMYSIFSTPPEKTFFNWVYITDGQKSTLTFWQDPSLCFFWSVILPQKILDFLLFLLWQKLQDNWHEEKCKSHDCVPKLPSPKPNQDKGIADVHNEVMEIVRSAHSIQSEDSGNVLQMTTAQGFPDQEQHLMPSIADVHNEVMEIVRSAHSIQSEDSGNVLQMTTAQGFPDQEQHLMPSIADVHNEVMEIVRSAHSIQSEDSGNVLQMTTAQGFPDQEQHLMPSIADVHNEVMEIVRSAHSIQSEDSGNVLQMTTAQGFPDQEQHLMPSIADVHNEVMEIVRSAHSIQSEDSGNVLQMTTAQGFPDQEQHLMPSIADVHNEVMEIVRSAHSIQSEDSGNVLQMTTAQGFADQEQHLMPSHSLLPLRDEPQEVKPKLKKLKLTRQDCPWSFKYNKLRSLILKVKQEFKNGGVTVSVEIVGDTDFVDLHFKTGVFQNASVKDERLSFIVRLGFCHWMYVYGEENYYYYYYYYYYYEYYYYCYYYCYYYYYYYYYCYYCYDYYYCYYYYYDYDYYCYCCYYCYYDYYDSHYNYYYYYDYYYCYDYYYYYYYYDCYYYCYDYYYYHYQYYYDYYYHHYYYYYRYFNGSI
uniref:uncharacterized protein n=1 Tax=Myxine glutinosa TaxID=7769 RepID=UPI00358E9368